MLPARRPQPAARRGVATVWLVLFLPLFLLMLCFVIESGNLWMARSELESALEAAALAAVKEWGDTSGGSTSTARQVGQSVAAANTVRGTSLVIGQNYTAGGANNENTNITFPPNTANLIFGALTSTSPTVVFCPTVTPSCGFGAVPDFAVRAESIKVITPVCSSLFGAILGSFQVHAQATAYYTCSTRCPSIIRVDTICP